MLSKVDLELFEVLDKEIDKTLSFGCYCQSFGNDNPLGALAGYYYIGIKGEEYYTCDNILGHYPNTNTVLRYCAVREHFTIFQNGKAIGISNIDNEWHFELDISKEIKDYTEEQKKDLLEFLKSL